MSDIIKETEEKDVIEEKDIGKILSLLSYFHEEKTNKVYIIDTYSYPFYLLTLFFRSRFPIIAYELKQKEVVEDKEKKVEKSKGLAPLSILFVHIARVYLGKLNNSLTPTDIDIYVKALVIVLFLGFILYRTTTERKKIINYFKSSGIKKYKVRLKKPKFKRSYIIGLILFTFFTLFLNAAAVLIIKHDNIYVVFLGAMFMGIICLHIVLMFFTLMGTEVEILKELEY